MPSKRQAADNTAATAKRQQVTKGGFVNKATLATPRPRRGSKTVTLDPDTIHVQSPPSRNRNPTPAPLFTSPTPATSRASSLTSEDLSNRVDGLSHSIHTLNVGQEAVREAIDEMKDRFETLEDSIASIVSALPQNRQPRDSTPTQLDPPLDSTDISHSMSPEKAIKSFLYWVDNVK